MFLNVHFVHAVLQPLSIPLNLDSRPPQASLFRVLSRMSGTQHIHTTSYHPASNGMVERFHRQLKAALRTSNSPECWTETLPIVLLGCRSAIKSDLGYSSTRTSLWH